MPEASAPIMTTGEPSRQAPAHSEPPELRLAEERTPPRHVERQATTIEVRDVNLFYGDFQAVQDVTMTIGIISTESAIEPMIPSRIPGPRKSSKSA